MAVEYINYKGEDLPVKVGYYALKMMQKKHDASLSELEGQFELYEPLLFYALEQWHKVEGKPFKFKIGDMVDVLDDCLFQFIEIIPKFFPEGLEKMLVGGGITPGKKGR